MNPFRNEPKPVRYCRPSERCEVCARGPDQLTVEFFATVRCSWSSAEMDVLSRAARSALL